MLFPFCVTYLLNIGYYWWYKGKGERKLASTKLQIKDTNICSVQYREALHKCLFTVCEEWCDNPEKEKKKLWERKKGNKKYQ